MYQNFRCFLTRKGDLVHPEYEKPTQNCSNRCAHCHRNWENTIRLRSEGKRSYGAEFNASNRPWNAREEKPQKDEKLKSKEKSYSEWF